MRRRDFVKRTSLAVTTGGLLAACGSESGDSSGPAVHTKKNVTWRLASSYPRSLDTIWGAAEVLGDTVEALTQGRFKIRSYPAGELVPGLQVFDAVQQGTIQMGHSASYYFIGKNPALAFDTCVPFGLTTRQRNAWVYHGGGLDVLRPVFSDFNMLNFPGGNTGVQMGGWFRREIGSVADISGLKMRIPGLGGKVMDRLGATVQVIAGGEIYQALDRGLIDAAEWVGPYDDEKLGFNKVAPYYYYPGWWEPGPMLTFYVNKDAWASLPADYKTAFEAAAKVANMDMTAKYDAKNPPALTRLIASGTQLRPFSNEILTAARRESFALMAEEAAADATYARVYQAWKLIHEEYYRWFATAESSYSAFAVSAM